MSNYRNINLDHYATIFKALSNPHRLQIFNILTGCCEPGSLCSTDDVMSCCVGDLDTQLNIASSTLSHHLKELNRAGLIEMQREGKQVFCSINPSTLAEVMNLFSTACQTNNP
ncbi:MAG: metalloregulator ArsR/SmtB family transcription factor [Gammaproteobacteria bacterium]|nr:metalloregulator ArsR/SmtB family transcription factor [Gammaproteobacteria bacterium]